MYLEVVGPAAAHKCALGPVGVVGGRPREAFQVARDRSWVVRMGLSVTSDLSLVLCDS